MIKYLSEWFDVKYKGLSLEGRSWVLYPKEEIKDIVLHIDHNGTTYEIDNPDYVKITNYFFFFNKVETAYERGVLIVGDGKITVAGVEK